MKLLDAKTAADLVKLLVFMVITALATGVLVVTIGNISFQPTSSYRADFADATGVVSGDDVRIAGVKVGVVKEVNIVEGDRCVSSDPAAGPQDESPSCAEVVFDVENGVSMSGATQAAIRYRNLVGQRYISLTETVGETGELEAGGTIPLDRTATALDLTVLFNGFKPLFEALSPDDLNQLSFEVVQVFQGEGGTVESLLASTASLTQTLADRDEVIGSLIDNLDFVLDRLADRDDQLSALIINFRQLVGGLREDRQAILGSLDGISRLSEQTADLVAGVRAPFVEDIKQLRRLATNIDDNKAELDRALQVLPIKLTKVGRTAIYGSWFNFYLCDLKGSVRLPGLTVPVNVTTGAERCDLG